MEPQVITFEVHPLKLRARFTSAAIWAVVWGLPMFALSTRREISKDLPLGWIVSLVIWVGAGFLGGLSMTYAVKRPLRHSYLIEEEQISYGRQFEGKAEWSYHQVVRKGKVRSIFRLVGGVGVSERSQFGARMLGFVVIPRALPQFEELRGLMESWRR